MLQLCPALQLSMAPMNDMDAMDGTTRPVLSL